LKGDKYDLSQCNKIKTLFSVLNGAYTLVTSKTRSF